MPRKKSIRARRCPSCHRPMRKKGFTPAGAQRWKCDACRLSCTGPDRKDLRDRAVFRHWIAWISGRTTAAEAASAMGVSRQTFWRRTSWCWQVPVPQPAKRGADYVQADGTYLPYGWCLLIACDAHAVPMAWQWCDRESTAAYGALFARIGNARALGCDGSASASRAARVRWGRRVAIQRCLVHVQRDGRRDLTCHPRTQPGRELRALYARLTRIHAPEDAARWANDLNSWHRRHAAFLKQRTWAGDDPGHPNALAGKQWWYTHPRVRRAYFRLAHLLERGELFAFLDPANPAAGAVKPTTNGIEGGVNAGLKRMLDLHRGLSEEHMKRAAEWYLYLKTGADPLDALDAYLASPPESNDPVRDDPPAPGTETGIQQPGPNPDNINAYESGFGIRKGWLR